MVFDFERFGGSGLVVGVAVAVGVVVLAVRGP